MCKRINRSIEDFDVISLYIDQQNGNDSNFVIDDINYPAKTVEAAIKKITTNNDFGCYNIVFVSDYIISHTITIDGINNSKILFTSLSKENPVNIYSGSSISLSEVINGENIYISPIEPSNIIVDKNVVELNSNCNIRKAEQYFHVTQGVRLSENYFRFSRPDGFPSVEIGTIVVISLVWNWYTFKLKNIDESYIYLESNNEFDTKYLHDGNGHSGILRLLNSESFVEDGTFRYYEDDKGYNICYADKNTVEEVRVPNVSNFFRIVNSKHISFENLKFFGNKGDNLYKAAQTDCYTNGRIILADYCEDINIKSCEFTKVHGYCVHLNKECYNCNISDNYIHDTFGGGFIVGPVDEYLGSDYPSYCIVSSNVTIKNNLIKSYGRYEGGSVGIFISFANKTTVVFNTVCDGLYTGISVGRYFSMAMANSVHSNYVSRNHVHHLGLGLISDLGGIYVQGRQPKTVIDRNLIHDIYSQKYNLIANGLYSDAGNSHTLFMRNKVYSCIRCFSNTYGVGNVVYANAFIYPLQIAIGSASFYNHGTIIVNNIIDLWHNNNLSDTLSERFLYCRNLIASYSTNNTIKDHLGDRLSYLSYNKASDGDFSVSDSYSKAIDYNFAVGLYPDFSIYATALVDTNYGIQNEVLKSKSLNNEVLELGGKHYEYIHFYKALIKLLYSETPMKLSNPYLDNVLEIQI